MNKIYANLAFSYVNDRLDTKDVSPKQKVIRMLSREFCIAVISGSKKVERLFQYSFLPEDLSFEKKINAIAKVNQELDVVCENNLLKLYTQYNVQVPEQFYEQENDIATLSLMVENAEDYIPLSEKIQAWNLYNISAWEKKLHDCIKKKFPDYELGTVVSSLYPVLARQKGNKEAVVFAGDNNFTVLTADRQKLLGINTFDFVNESDFLYCLYGFLRKMYIYPDTVSLKLCGNIAVKSSLYDILNKYFSDVELVSSLHAIENYSCFCDLFE
jgi:hypothetical protein